MRGKTKKWLGSYLKNRKQYINFNKKGFIDFCNITFGVPQGSILGPLLFLIYVNDLYIASSKISAVILADNTNFFLSDKNISGDLRPVQKILHYVSRYLETNTFTGIIELHYIHM